MSQSPATVGAGGLRFFHPGLHKYVKQWRYFEKKIDMMGMSVHLSPKSYGPLFWDFMI